MEGRELMEYLLAGRNVVIAHLATAEGKQGKLYTHVIATVLEYSKMDDRALVRVVTDFSEGSKVPSGSEWQVKIMYLRKPAWEAFPVGTKVQSDVGSARFVVTGHEERTNRVIVCPISLDPMRTSERRRYSYQVSELHVMVEEKKPEPPKPVLIPVKIGERYILQKLGEEKITVVIATADPQDKGYILLVGMLGMHAGLSYRLKWLNGKIDAEELRKAGFKIIQ